MNYFNELKLHNNLILSCDKLRLDFHLSNSGLKKLNDSLNFLSLKNSCYDFKLFSSLSFFSYKYLLVFKNNDSVVQIGLGFNGVNFDDCHKCFIEFNPNKTMYNNYVQILLDIIKQYTHFLDLSRFDFAIDIPVKRGSVILSKDKRNYQKVYKLTQSANNVDNFTEYLGQRNNNGFVKLYNKTIESNLNYDLTRLEITLDSFDFDNFKKELPKVYYFNRVDLLTLSNLTDTDRVFLRLLADSDNPLMYCNMLSRDKKDKYKNILFNLLQLDISQDIFFSLICRIRSIYC